MESASMTMTSNARNRDKGEHRAPKHYQTLRTDRGDDRSLPTATPSGISNGISSNGSSSNGSSNGISSNGSSSSSRRKEFLFEETTFSPANDGLVDAAAAAAAAGPGNNTTATANAALAVSAAAAAEHEPSASAHYLYPLPEVVRRCWPKLFPTMSSAKKSIRKGVFWVGPMNDSHGPCDERKHKHKRKHEESSSAGSNDRDNNNNNNNNTGGDDNDNGNGNGNGNGSPALVVCESECESESTRWLFRKGTCGTKVRPGDRIRRKLPPREPNFRNRGRSTREVLDRSIGGKLRIAYMDRCLAVVVKPQGMSVNKAAVTDANVNANVNVNANANANANAADKGTSGKSCKHAASNNTRDPEVSMHELLLHCLPPLPTADPICWNDADDVDDAVEDKDGGADTNENDALRRPAYVHRLDQPTYGLLIVARTGSTARFLSRVFEERAESLVKRYRAIIHGHIEGEAGKASFVRSPQSGKECLTEYRIVRRWEVVAAAVAVTATATAAAASVGEDSAGGHPNPEPNTGTDAGGAMAMDHRGPVPVRMPVRARVPLTLVDLFPHTGRKHQLRRHMASIGHPIVGDTRYGSSSSSTDDARISRSCCLFDTNRNRNRTPDAHPSPQQNCSSQPVIAMAMAMATPRPPGEGSSSSPPLLPLMLAAVEVVFPHPESIRDPQFCAKQTQIPNDKRPGRDADADAAVANRSGMDSTENYVLAEDSEHSFDASNGTLRVKIGMPEAMERIAASCSCN